VTGQVVRHLSRVRLLPRKLFNQSFRSNVVELLASAIGNVSLRQHRALLYVDRESGESHQRSAGFQPPAIPHPKQQVAEVWKVHQWYYHAECAVNVVDDYVHRWFREFLTHGTVWTGNCENAVSRSQRLKAKPLKSSDWPSSRLGPSWPSFPSIPEWMEMLRKGINPFERVELKQPTTNLGFTQVGRRELSENPYLATRIAVNAIVGVRDSVKVPEKFLGYFRCRHNFLIWTTTFNVPIGLVRFLLAQWVRCPYSLWLRRAVPLKKFLRKVPTSLVKRARSRRELEAVAASFSELGVCAHPADSDTDETSVAESELD